MLREKHAPKLAWLAGIAVTMAAGGLQPAYSQPASAPNPGYVDSRVCASCHREIANNYKLTGMGRSFYRPTPLNTVEDYATRNTFYHAESDTHFAMEQRGGEYFQRRWQTGFDGKPVNSEEMRVDYVMGSGNHARSYLTRTAVGTLIELPLGWFPATASDSGGWGMSPGSETSHPLTRRFITYKCMFCHNAVPEIPAANVGPDSDPVFTGNLPEGIDCQRCHGPGAAHLRAVSKADAKSAEIRASIVNPKRLSPERSMEVCMQCHLETTSTRIPATVVRFNRAPFSYRAGEPLGDFMLSFDHAPGTGHEDKFETVSSVYRFRQSKCFTESAGRLTCQTCHDPHRVPRGEDAVKAYSAVCSECHTTKSLSASASHPTGADCVTCHMPKRRADDIPRMVMTDHFIRRKPSLVLASMAVPSIEAYRGPISAYYPAPLPKTGENALYLASAQVGLGNNMEAGLPQLAEEMARQKPRDPEFYMVLGDALEAAGKSKEAAAAYEQGLQLNPNSVRGLRSLGTEASLKKAVELAPSDPESWYRYGLLDAEAGRVAQAVEKIRKAIALDPTLPGKSYRLAELLAKAGDKAAAQNALDDALRANPYDEDAWDLSGRLHSEMGEVREALFAFEKAVRLRPESATLLYDYALALARAGRFDDAQPRAEAVIRLDAERADAHELLGGLFEQKKQLPQAVAEYRTTLRLQPGLSRIHLRLGNILGAQGDRNSAIAEFREAAKGSDEAIAQRASRILLEMGVQ